MTQLVMIRTLLRCAPLALVALLTACESGPGLESRVAVVNGKPITKPVFEAYVARRSGGAAMSAEDRADLLNQVISIELLMQDALKQGLDREAATANELAVQRATLLANAAIRAHLDANPVTDDAVRAEYQKRAGELAQTEYKARHILVPSEAEAREVIAQLDRGTKFDRLARNRSTDEGSANQGGDLGWFSPQMMVKPFADAVIALGEGGRSKTPVQSQFGWHVILVEGKRALPPPPFEQLEARIKGELQNQLVEAYINGLRGAAKIETIDEAPAASPHADAPAAEQTVPPAEG